MTEAQHPITASHELATGELHEQIYTVESASSRGALEQLSNLPPGERMWNSVPLIRSGVEVDIIDAETRKESAHKVFLRLPPERWAEVYEELGDRPDAVDGEYSWTQKSTGEAVWVQNKPASSRSIVDTETGASLTLISSQQSLSYDGLVEISVPKTGDIDAEAVLIDSSLVYILGSQSGEEYGAEWLRAYNKLPFGPLTKQQTEQMATAVEARQLSPHHIAPVVKGLHKMYTHERSGEQLTARHDIQYVSDAIDIIANGGITPTLERLKRGEGDVKGRSSYADINFGGADSVFAYFTGAESDEHRTSSYFKCKPKILDRLDVRVYQDDAYGSRERTVVNEVDRALGRVVLADTYSVIPRYHDRVEPSKFDSVGGVHEVCFEKEIGIAECEKLVLQDTGSPSFEDFRWDSVLPEIKYEEWQLDTYNQSLKNEVQSRIKTAWGDEAAVRAVLTEWLPEMQPKAVEYVVVGMNLPLRDRTLARLAARGITEINGRPIEDFVQVLSHS